MLFLSLLPGRLFHSIISLIFVKNFYNFFSFQHYNIIFFYDCSYTFIEYLIIYKLELYKKIINFLLFFYNKCYFLNNEILSSNNCS